MDQNRVVIIGGDHQNTLGVIRALGANGYITNVIIHHFLRLLCGKQSQDSPSD